MITEALLAGILGSQWAIAQKMGVKADELGRSISQGMAQQIVAQGMIPHQLPEGLLPYTRLTLDLTEARDFAEIAIAGQWLTVESCDGTGIAAYLNQKGSGDTPDPLYLDQIVSVSFPFKRLYLSHAAQPGKAITLLIGRINLQIQKTDPSINKLRWGKDMTTHSWADHEPWWETGGLYTVVSAGDYLLQLQVEPYTRCDIYGISISADEANVFDLKVEGDLELSFPLASAGVIFVVSPWAGVAPLIEAMRQTKVTGKADKVLALKKSSRGLTSGQMLECFVLLSALGGDCLDDMGRLRRDEALSQMLGYDIPAPETARQW